MNRRFLPRTSAYTASWNGTATDAARLADERAVDQLHLGRPPRLDVLEHRREVRDAALRGEHVHLPRIVVQARSPLHAATALPSSTSACTSRPSDHGSSSSREVEVVRQPRQRRDAVHRRVEDQLRPLRRPQVAAAPRPSAPSARSARRPPARARTACPRTARATSPCRGCTGRACPSASSRDERHGRDQRPVAEPPDDLLGAEPVQHRHHGRARPATGERRSDRLSPCAFVATMTRSGSGSASARHGGGHARRRAPPCR